MLRFPGFLGLVLALWSAPVSAGVGFWSSNGPEGVSYPVLVFDPVNASVAYLKTGPDLFKTVNAGETWNRILPGGGPPAVSPTNPSVLMTTIAYDTLARSEDAGANWTTLPGPDQPGTNYELVFDVQDPNVVFLAQQIANGTFYVGAVYKSIDGGRTWSELLRQGMANPGFTADPDGVWVTWGSIVGLPTIVNRIPRDGSGVRTLQVPFEFRSFAADPSDPTRLYVGTAEGLGRSRDGGQTWTMVPLPGPVSIVEINPASPSEILASDKDGLIRSTDFGATWNPFSLAPVDFLAFDPFYSSTIYGRLGSQLVRTTNRGAEWKTIVKGLATTSVSTVASDIGRPGRFYAAAGPDVFRTADGGDSWSLLGSVPGVQTITAVAFSSASGLLVAATWPPGLVTTSDEGRTWRVMGFDARFVVVAPSDPRVLYAGNVGQDELFRSRDGGVTWTRIVGFEPVELTVDPRNPDLLYATGFTKSAHGLFESTDGGSSWSLVRDDAGRLTGVGPIVVDPHDPRKLYRGAGGFFRSLDGGLSWETRGSFSQIESLVAHPSVPGLLFLYDCQGPIYVSYDFGASWSPFLTPPNLTPPNLGGTVSTLAIDSGGKTLQATSGNSGVYSYRFTEARVPIGSRIPARSDRRVLFRP